jgi:hypothetical protein
MHQDQQKQKTEIFSPYESIYGEQSAVTENAASGTSLRI